MKFSFDREEDISVPFHFKLSEVYFLHYFTRHSTSMKDFVKQMKHMEFLKCFIFYIEKGSSNFTILKFSDQYIKTSSVNFKVILNYSVYNKVKFWLSIIYNYKILGL